MLTRETVRGRRLLPGSPCEGILQKLRRRASAQASAEVSEHEVQLHMSDSESDDDQADSIGSQLSAPRREAPSRIRRPLRSLAARTRTRSQLGRNPNERRGADADTEEEPDTEHEALPA
jgi:hypothetical protein